MNLPLIFTESVQHFKKMQKIFLEVLFVPILDTWIFGKNVRFPYIMEEGGGQERYKNFLILYFLNRGRGEGVQVNKCGWVVCVVIG